MLAAVSRWKSRPPAPVELEEHLRLVELLVAVRRGVVELVARQEGILFQHIEFAVEASAARDRVPAPLEADAARERALEFGQRHVRRRVVHVGGVNEEGTHVAGVEDVAEGG